MAYYVRKIARSKWQENPLDKNLPNTDVMVQKVAADAITNCTKTTANKLSLWKVEKINNTIDDIVPLIIGFERPDTCDVIYIPEEELKNEGIELEQSSIDANTPIEELKKLHYNAIVNDYEGLGKFAKVVLVSLENHKRFKGKEVKEKLQKMLENHEIEKGMISDKLYEKIS